MNSLHIYTAYIIYIPITVCIYATVYNCASKVSKCKES